jgi:hypothetical protein
LITNNLDAKLPSAPDNYAAVVKIWHNAMQVLDNLIVGMPQSVHDADLLLGLSSWHLYPNMTVVHTKIKHVEQNDKLVAPGGIVTLGLRVPENEGTGGVLWSLPLSHLRYYGKPVRATGELGICTSRITFEQFLFISLGSLTRAWPGRHDLVVRAILAISQLWQKAGETMPDWIQLYFETVQWYNSLAGKEREQAEQLFYFGRRRCQTLFGSSAPKISVAFGLCKVENFVRVLPGAECRIAWMREFLAPLRSKYPHLDGALIRYSPDGGESLESLHQLNRDNQFIANNSCTRWEAVGYRHILEAADRVVSGDQNVGELEDRLRGETGEENTNFAATLSRLTNWRDLGERMERLIHDQHPDSEIPEVLTEYATLHQSLNTDNTTSHKRWVPANENEILSKPATNDLVCQWALKGFSCPLSAAVHRTQILKDLTGEKCGLYRTAKLAEPDKRVFFPQLDPVQPRTSQDLSGKATETSEEVTVQISIGSARRLRSAQGDSPRKKRKTSEGKGCPSKWYIPNLEGNLNEDQSYVPEKSLFGSDDAAVLLAPWAQDKTTILPEKLEVDYVISKIEAGFITTDSSRLLVDDMIEKPPDDSKSKVNKVRKTQLEEFHKSIGAFLMAAEVYRDLPNSTINIGVTSQPLAAAKYFQINTAKCPQIKTSKLADKFSCIAFFESAIINIDPTELSEVIAISSGNSLHIAACCLQDPARDENTNRTMHAIGNVGKPGLCFLFSPKTPMVQEPRRDQWQLVSHLPFDGELESNFQSATTLHLSFTGYQFPVQTVDHGGLDRDAFFVEAAVRVFDMGEWIADIDIISALRQLDYTARRLGTCNHSPEEKGRFHHLNLTCVDSWIELLDAPTTAHVMRAKKDWISRLAAFAVATQTRRSVLIASDSVCWRCVEDVATTVLKFHLAGESSWRLGVSEDWNKLLILC